MIDSNLRGRYQTVFVNPFLPLFMRLRWSPLTYTLIGMVLGVGVLPALFFQQTVLALVLLALSGYFDTLDGTIARATDSTSPKGAMLDIVSDRMVESSVIIGLFLVEPESRGLLSLLMLASVLLCVTTFLVVGIFINNGSEKSFHYHPGIMERTEAFILFGLMILFPSAFFWLGSVFAGLVALTGFVRVWEFSSHSLSCNK